MNTPEQLREEIETILELDPGTLNGSEFLADIGWDSLAVVTFIANADAKYGIAVNVAKLQDATTLNDLWNTLEKEDNIASA